MTFRVRVIVSQALVGSKFAFGDDHTIMVSPAMHDLIKHAEGSDLEKLLEQIPLKYFPLTESFNMFGKLTGPFLRWPR